MTKPSVVYSDQEILGGVPVFVGTRVTVQTLLDYLGDGDSVEVCVDHFPRVNRKQAIAVLELAKEMLVAHSSAARCRPNIRIHRTALMLTVTGTARTMKTNGSRD